MDTIQWENGLGFIRKQGEHEPEQGASCILLWFLFQIPALTTAITTKLQQYVMLSFCNMLFHVQVVLFSFFN